MDLQDFIQEVLDNEFCTEPKKREIQPTKNGFNFACPFCGDSMTSVSKKRGNIYLNSKTFKCFNDGCMTWMPLRRFVSTFAQKFEIDISALDIEFDAEYDSRDRLVRIEDNNVMKFLSDSGALGTMLDVAYVRDRFSLINVRTMSQGTKTWQFLENRRLFNIPNVDEFIYGDNSDSLIYIFNYHRHTGKILSLATRKIEYKKYKVIPYSHICDSLHIPKVEEHYQFVDELGEYFNLLNVDFTKPVRVTEGQIDSMFLHNGMAMQGVTKSMFILDYVADENVWTMFDRDKGGITASVREIQNGRKTFMWSLLLKRLKRRFPSEIPSLLKIKDTNDLYKFLYDRTKLPFWRFNSLIDGYFTSSKFDMVYL
jgi:predicted RNA-binding Zn-ribbon protein involved in translation (DUF1610 family)